MALSFADLLDLLGHDGYTSVCNKPPGGVFSSQVVEAKLAPAVVADLAGDIWFGVNPVLGPARINQGRGTAADVVRLAAVYADLDIKSSGMASFEDAWAVVDDLSTMLNARPSVTVLSGHGIQPYWPLDTTSGPATGGDARALLRRWGRLVMYVAETRGGHADMVFDLARVLRVPGTMNFKDQSQPAAVVGIPGEHGRPLDTDELDEALTAYGAGEMDGDREEPGRFAVSPPTEWQWGEQTCNYAVKMIDGWAGENPGARHPWLLRQATRLAAAHRYGCFDAAGYHGAAGVLVGHFRRLLASGPEARQEAPGEISDALAWGQRLAASKSDAQVASELGNHSHENPGDLTFEGGPAGSGEYSTPENASHDDLLFHKDVEIAVRKLRIQAAARKIIADEDAADIPPFDAGTLGEILQRPAEPPYRVEGLIPNEASALIVAMRKTGKTTLNLNLARSLILGNEFLGKFGVRPINGNVGLLNYEVSAAQIARWAHEVGIPHDRLCIVNLRGRRNPLGNDDDKERLATWLRDHDVESLLVDPFGRAYTGVSQNDSGEVGAWLADLDRWARGDAGVLDLVLAVHAGWEGERSRGASALEDWGDTIITMTRKKADDDDGDDGHRYLRAEGRDVDLDEDQLQYDPATRLLSLTGFGGRKKASVTSRVEKLIPVVVGYVESNPACSQRDMESGLPHRSTDVRKAAEMAAARGLIRRTSIGNGFSHMPAEWGVLGADRQVRPATESHLVSEVRPDALLSQNVDPTETVVPLFQAGEGVRPGASQVRPGRTGGGASPAYLYAGRPGHASGTRNEACSNPAHTPTMRKGRWECDDCDREHGGSAS